MSEYPAIMGDYRRIVVKFALVVDCAEDIADESRFDHPTWSSVELIRDAVEKAGFACSIFGGIKELIHAYDSARVFDSDEVFLNFSTGLTQKHRQIQAPVLLELLDVPYACSEPFALALADNKHFSKLAVRENGLCNIPEGILITDEAELKRISSLNNYPYLVKPNGEGGSLGIHQRNVVINPHEALHVAREVLMRYGEVLVEQYVAGVDLTNMVFGNHGETTFNEVIVYKTAGSYLQQNKVRDFETKYSNDPTLQKELLQEVSRDTGFASKVKATTLGIIDTIGTRDIARVDYRVTESGDLFFLEINALPRIDPRDAYGVNLHKLRMTFDDYIKAFVETVVRRMNA
ncbi:hypothetical protein [Gordonibacter urolithinfaciens]|uniref:hypothetical protein n=1 Tax=Gordonibacter urolithinfaciens TaxID=1335613 RepID=UPI003AACCE9B